MPHTRPPYPAEFRRQIVELVRAGRDPTDLAREFEPSAQAIRNWVAQADKTEERREAKTESNYPGGLARSTGRLSLSAMGWLARGWLSRGWY
jgi:transposase-like protein